MLLLVFNINDDCFALDTSNVIEVVPLINLQSLPNSPDSVAGIFNYHGSSVPVIDMCRYFNKVDYSKNYNTRIILIKYTDASESRLVGLIAEKVTDVVQHDAKEFKSSGLKLDASPFLGKVVMGDQGMIQSIEPDKLLSEELTKLLFTDNGN